VKCKSPNWVNFAGWGQQELPLSTDTVEKLDFLPRSQFLRQQVGFKKKALGFGRKADFLVCGGRSELAMATRGAIGPT
jgi:hypothetical protein